MEVAVFGLGYVGMVNIACLADKGHKVIGCDVKPHKVTLVNSHESTIYEPGITELMKDGGAKGLISASVEVKDVIANSTVALVCVGTPSDAEGNVNLNYIINTAHDISSAVYANKKRYTIIFRSTIPPGTIQNVLLKEIEKVDNEHLIDVVFLPEFLREGNAVYDFNHGARVVAGVNKKGNGKEVVDALFGFNKSTPIVYTDYNTAEFVKYVDNAYHATKVAFANEVYSIGAGFNIDVKLANDIFLMDNSLNISTKYLRPGMPFGGSCLPKDSRAILHLANQVNVQSPFFDGVLSSNTAHQNRLLKRVIESGKQQVLIWGLTFKSNTDDIRESPFLFLLRDLVKLNYEVKVYDPKLNVSNLRIEFPDVVKHLCASIDEACNWAGTIVYNEKDIDTFKQQVSQNKPVLDCNGDLSALTEWKGVRNLFN